MAKKFFNALQPEVQDTDQKFYDYIYFNWPTFSSFKALTSNRVTWGRVVKGHLEPNKVNILSTIVESADAVSPVFFKLQQG